MLTFEDDASSGPPVPPVERNDQMRMARKQIGTRIDFVMKR
jgi:hypothetical protein